MQVGHIIFLIHPCCYEPLVPEVIDRDNMQLFVECERVIKVRWLNALADRPANTLYAGSSESPAGSTAHG